MFGDLAPGDTVATETATGQLIDPAAPPVTDGPEGQAAPPAASMGPATPTPGLIDWMAGTGNEPLFGDRSPGDPTGGQGPPNATETPTDTQSLINVIQPTPYDVTVVDPTTGKPLDPSVGPQAAAGAPSEPFPEPETARWSGRPPQTEPSG